MPLVYLAAWRINAAVAPIDCEDRDEELADVIKRLDAAVVVCEAKDAERLGRLTPVPVLASLVVDEACAAPPVPFASDAYAHCFFTSGSTGRPKGCLVTRNALATYARARNRVDGVDATSVLLLASHHAFDPTVGDVAQCALSQASLCCAPRQRVLLALDELLRSSRCTHVTTTPPLFNTCVGGRFPDLKVVALGGEALPPKLVEAFSGTFSLVSVYGVTECCVYQAHRVVTSVGDCGLLGPALVGTISLEDGEVVLRGPLVDGASYLGGESGGHGSDGQGRYYRTGDGGVVEDGAIRLQGRLDDQIKRSGRRTELGALDAALEATALVAACRFVLVDDALVACCASPQARSTTLEADAALGPAVQAAARACLKPYVQPAAVLFAKTLPRTRTDKIDRRACQAAAALALRDRPPPGPPTSTTTNAVLDAFAAVLGRPVTGDTSFAALGGTSLQAVEAAWRLGVAPDDVLSLSIGELAPLVSSRAPAPPADENALAPPPPKRARTTTLRRAWSLQLKACVDAAVALFDDGRKGLVASHGRDLVCFDTRSGEALWTARVGLGASLAGEADAAVEAPCLIADGTAFVGGYDGRVYAVAVADGTLRWTSAPCAGPIKGAATALDATTLVVGSHGGFVRALALADGSVRRTSEHLGGAVFAAPTLAGEVLVVATTAGVVHGLEAATLAPLWRKAGAPVFAQPVVHEDAVIYGDVSGAVHAVSHDDGAGRWSIVGSAAPVYAPVAVIGANVCVADDRGGLVFRDATSGALKHRRSVPGAKFFKAPALVSDTLVAVSTDGRVFVVSATDGAPIAECDLGAKAFSAPVIVGLKRTRSGGVAGRVRASQSLRSCAPSL